MRGLAARVVLLDGWRRRGLAFLAGAVATLGLAPFNIPAAGFVSFPLLVWMLDGAAGAPGAGVLRRLAPAFRIGWMFGFGYFTAGLWWLGAAMLNDAGAFLWAIPLAVVILPAICAIYFGLAAALARTVWSGGTGRILALAASFALFELLRGRLFTGFPWNEIGVLAAPVPVLMQSLALVGLHGLTLAALYVFAAPALLGDARPRRAGLALAIGLALFHVGFGVVRLATADAGTVAGIGLRVVQPDIPQSEKWDAAEADRIFDRLVTLTELRPPAPPAPAAGPAGSPASPGTPPAQTLVIWPESSFPFLLTERPDAIARLAEALRPGETLVAGAARLEVAAGGGRPRVYNSLYAIDADGGIVDARDKVHLVPFGEYLPFQRLLERFGVSQMARLPGGFSAGAARKALVLPGVPGFLPLICYEVIFQDEIVADAAAAPGFIINVTNDAWYGRTPGPYQHLRQAELAAVAFGLPLVRSANTGISVVGDAYGRQVAGLALGTAGTIEADLPATASPTFFAQYGNRPFFCALAMAWIMACVLLMKDARRD